MRIRVKPSHRRMDRVTINMASMIDVTFLLLFFFMVATVLGEQESRLSTALQTQSDGAGAAADFQPQNIEVRVIDGAPGYRIGAASCRDRSELADALEPLPKSAGVFIKVYDQVPVGFAVAAVQVARDAGFEKVTYVPGR